MEDQPSIRDDGPASESESETQPATAQFTQPEGRELAAGWHCRAPAGLTRTPGPGPVEAQAADPGPAADS